MKNKYKLKYQKDSDIYKQVADDSLMRLQFFINDILGCVETMPLKEEALTNVKELIKFYTNICVKECEDGSLPKGIENIIANMIDENKDEKFELVLEAISEVLCDLDLYNNKEVENDN